MPAESQIIARLHSAASRAAKHPDGSYARRQDVASASGTWARASTAHKLVRQVVTGIQNMKGKRDRALLPLGFAGGLLRSELLPRDIANLALDVEVQLVIVHRSVAMLRGYVRRATLFDDAPFSTITGKGR